MRRTKEKAPVPLARRIEFILAGCLYYTGLIRLSRWWTGRTGPTLSILCYHSASGGYFSEHLLYLKRHYRILHLEAALEELYSPTKNTRRDRRPLLAVTSDDGYHDLYTYALPLADELQIPLTIFLVPGYIESGKRFWWLEPEYLLQHTQVSEAIVEGKTYHLWDSVERQSIYQTLDTRLRHAASVAEREAFLEAARSTLALSYSSEPLEQRTNLSPLTWTEVAEMEKSEWISFGAHTMHHPTLAYLHNPSELQYEVSNCRAVLEEQLGHPVRVFAYPIGKNEHFANEDVQAVKVAGYHWAVTTLHGLNTSQTDPYRLKRIVVDIDQRWLLIAAKTSGLWDFLVHLGRMPVTFFRNMFK